MARIANPARPGAHRSKLVDCAADSPASVSGDRRLRGWMRAPVLSSALAVAGIACAPAPPQRFPAKPPRCALETLKVLPERPYIELETFSLTSPDSMRGVLDIVQERACRDGADAIYAPKGGRVYSYAIALKWNDPPAPAAPPAAAPPPPALPADPPRADVPTPRALPADAPQADAPTPPAPPPSR